MTEQKEDILLFVEGITLVSDEFYVDATKKFNEIIDSYPESEIADDSLYNIARCYFELNQFDIALEKIKELEIKFPDSTIQPSKEIEEKGKTLAKAKYLQLNCLLGLNRINDAEAIAKELDDFNDSYIVVDNEKITFKELAIAALQKYNSIK